MKGQNEKVESIGKMLQKGLEELFTGDKYKAFLKMTARFPNYSYRNILLLLRQCPHASMTKGFKGWKKVGRSVMEGQKGLRIIAAFVKDDEKENDKNKSEYDVDKFRRISVFDISQTEPLDGWQGDAFIVPEPVQIVQYPFGAKQLEGDVIGFAELMAVFDAISPFPISIEIISGPRNGYCNYSQNKIGIKQGMSQLQTVKTVIHEIAHGFLHFDVEKDKRQKEIEAESTAYIVCQYYGLDTSDYSFSYIAGYSTGKEKKELKDFLDTIQKTASFIIDAIEGEKEARRISYNNGGLSILVNQKTVMRLYRDGLPVYLVYPEKGELFVTSKNEIEGHFGPFAVERGAWMGVGKAA